MVRVLLVLCLALAAAGSAEAKSLDYRVCGADVCKRLGPGAPAAGLFGGTMVAPGAPGPYYEIRVLGHDGRWAGHWAYVPGAQAIWRGNAGTWTRLTAAEDAQWRRFVRGVKPYSVPSVRRATIGGRPVEDPSSYLALLAAPVRVSAFSGVPEPVVLESARMSPWTGMTPIADFYARQGVLVAAGMILRLPPAMAERARQGKSLRPDV